MNFAALLIEMTLAASVSGATHFARIAESYRNGGATVPVVSELLKRSPAKGLVPASVDSTGRELVDFNRAGSLGYHLKALGARCSGPPPGSHIDSSRKRLVGALD